MDKWDKRARASFLEKGIRKILGARSPKRTETENRDPHTIPTPFWLESPHTHQDAKASITSPATFLACATKKKDGVPGELMGIKLYRKEKKGDQKVVVICSCANLAETDNQRQAYAQKKVEGRKPTISQGSHLVSSRAIFLRPDSQPADKDIFLLQVTHPSISQNTPDELKSSAAQALKMIKEGLKLEELHHTAEVAKNHFNKYLASAPPYEEIVKQEQEHGASGGIEEVKKEPTLPFDSGDKIPGSKEDQDMWIMLNMPLLK